MLSPRSDRAYQSLREPAVDRSEKLAGIIPLALVALEPRHAHCGAEFHWLLYDLTHKVIPRGRQRCAAWQSQPEIGRCETTCSTGSINQLTSSVQVRTLEGADHSDHQPIMGFIGVGALVRFSQKVGLSPPLNV